ncbi:MAG: glycerophosphodiester phosphodiesterase [Kiritimatiellae bacterium]|nr:glycerophosphodiester phosphodiesterase [Kiritimatiellia bacterium]
MSVPFPRLCANRGVSLACPENTLPAFGAALALGVHEIEFDLWMSKDGVPVVCHDPDVKRTTDGKGLLAEMKWAEISRLDAGIKCGEVWRGVRMPRFEEVVEFTDGRVGLNIHIKEAGPEGWLVKRVGDILREQALIHLAYIAGDAGSVLQTAMELSPEIPRACLMSQNGSMRQIELAKKYACRYVQFGRGVHEEEIRCAHEKSLVCNLFWSDEPEDARNYVRQGIDIILTNSPQLLISAGFPTLHSDRTMENIKSEGGK